MPDLNSLRAALVVLCLGALFGFGFAAMQDAYAMITPRLARIIVIIIIIIIIVIIIFGAV
jgi:hypothetical protein